MCIRDSSYTITAFRQAVMANGSVRQIVGTSSGAQQMVVGKLAKNGEWGSYSVIISTTLTRVSEAAVVQGQLMPAIFVGMLAPVSYTHLKRAGRWKSATAPRRRPAAA